MPLLVPPQVAKTTRSPLVSGLDEVTALMTPMRARAAERGVDLDLVYSYPDRSIAADPTKDVERHRETLAELEAAGVTWVVVSGVAGDHETTVSFIEAFGATYVQQTSP
jgi:hypothetical protein